MNKHNVTLFKNIKDIVNIEKANIRMERIRKTRTWNFVESLRMGDAIKMKKELENKATIHPSRSARQREKR